MNIGDRIKVRTNGITGPAGLYDAEVIEIKNYDLAMGVTARLPDGRELWFPTWVRKSKHGSWERPEF